MLTSVEFIEKLEAFAEANGYRVLTGRTQVVRWRPERPELIRIQIVRAPQEGEDHAE